MGNDNLSHEEIWDDTALQSSWDDALAEYKKYHSMAAKGEQVDLKELGGDDEVKIKKKTSIKTQKPSTLSNGTANANIEQSHATAGANATSVPASAGPSTPAVAPNPPVAGGAMPQALLSSVQDEGLKNLMMSWYYAGYYTGLLEGQQKAYANMQQEG